MLVVYTEDRQITYGPGGWWRLDHPRGDWADSIARRYLYDTADGIRLDALADSSFVPLRELVA